METFTLNLSQEYNAPPEAVFKKIEDGRLFELTGADEVTLAFHEDGAFSMLFTGRGEIYGTFKKIVPHKKITANWSVSGFYDTKEIDTHLEIILEEKNGGTLLTLLNSGISEKESYEAKKRAWTEILEDLGKEI